MSEGFSPDLLEKPRLSRFIVAAFRRHWQWALLVALLRMVSLSTHVSWPLFTKYATDYLILFHDSGHIDWNMMFWIMALGFVGWFGTDLPDITARLISGKSVAQIRAYMRTLVLGDMYKQSQQFFHDRFSGSISSSLRDLSESVSDIAYEVVFQFIPAIVLVLCLSAIFLQMHVGYIILMALWMLAQVLIIVVTRKKSQDKSASYANARTELFGKIIDSLSNHLSVRSFGAQELEQKEIRLVEDKTTESRVNVVRYAEKIDIVVAFIEAGFVFFGFIGVYMYLFQKGQATPGDLMFVINGAWGLMTTFNQITSRMLWLYEQIGVGQEAINKILVPHTVQDKPGATDIRMKDGGLAIRDVDFYYNKDKPIINKLSLTIPGGQKVGLIGYSGAGKTTFVNLLMRFYDANSGTIKMDGQNIEDVTQESLRRNIAMIPQDIALFHRSLADNIRIARSDATDGEIIEAARLAGAHDFISELPQKYETLVGERGIKLSGGQRQRIAIARAFLKAAPILILDEATSALDSMTESEIQNALDKVMAGRTTLVIAHRLSTLRRMDRLLVFHNGQVIEDGTHEQLLALNGHYAGMWAMQAGGFLPDGDPEILEQEKDTPVVMYPVLDNFQHDDLGRESDD